MDYTCKNCVYYEHYEGKEGSCDLYFACVEENSEICPNFEEAE